MTLLGMKRLGYETSWVRNDQKPLTKPQVNRHSAQITAHASVADVPVSNIKDLDLNQGDTIITL